ncbi:MAG: Ig-like domain-containing protein [Planctomycetota bacterium]|jgi:hypothetical protein
MNMLRSIGGTIQAAALAAALCGGMLVLVTGCPTAGGGGGGDGSGVVDECEVNADCADDLFCNGVGSCVDGQCVDRDPCEAGETCDEEADVCSALAFVGTETCLGCHGAAAVTGTDLSSFLNTGHPYKINEVVDGQMPTYPLSSIEGALEMVDDDDLPLDDGTPDPGPGTDNSLGTPQSYDDVSFVIGGFGWKARFMDLDGFIVTGSDVQYNLETQGMVSYHNNEVDKPFNCGNCHTTGWRAYTSEEGDGRNLNRQNDLPGMAGTFALAGIQCESCHGAGSAHATAPSADNITRNATPRTTEDFLAEDMAFGLPVACSDCHTRHAEKDYPTYEGGVGLILASGGLIRHHEQNDEMLGIDPDDETAGPTGPHASLECISCHNPHTTTRYMDVSGDPPGMDTVCTECHSPDEYEITSGGMTELACIDCHMPLLAKSALAHAAEGTGPVTGDIKTHIFRIDLTQENQFTEDGAFAYPRITTEFACKTCHNGVTAADFTVEFLSTQTIHPE